MDQSIERTVARAGQSHAAVRRTLRGVSVRFVWEDAAMDLAYFEEIAGQMRGLLIRLDDRLPSEEAAVVSDYIDANELGLALEHMADVLSEDDQPVTADERADMLALSQRMAMADRVPRALADCPAR